MFKEIGDINVRYEVSGEGDPLILIHGAQMRLACWEQMVPELSKEFKVWRYDVRGHGQTKRPPGTELSHDLWADDLARFMDAFGIEKAPVAGWSMGGAIGLDFAVRHPSRLTHLILIGAGSPLMPRTDRSGFDRRREMKEAGASGEEIMDETFEFTMKAFSPESLKERPAGVQRVKELLAAHYSLPIEEMSIPSRARADIGSELGDIQCPTLILVGDYDPLTPVAESESLSAAIPNSYMKIIPNCGHNYAFEQPEITTQALMTFVKAF